MNKLNERGKRGFKRTVFIVLPVLLLVAAIVPVFLSTSAPAGATNMSDLARVRAYVSSYISNQFTPGSEGEDGFLISAASLHSRLNPISDGFVLGEGDDAAGAPVLVDNLANQTSWIPGTTNRCAWNTGAGTPGVLENCFDPAVLDQVRARADAHAAAGFSTDIVVYCYSGRTEAPTTGAFGYIAQTGRLRSDGSIPNVYALKWGRNGWTNTVGSYNAANPMGPFDPPSTYEIPISAPPPCTSIDGDAELVRCQAQWAIYSGPIMGVSGGNIGNGQTPSGTSPGQTLATSQIVDIRTGGPLLGIRSGTIPSVNIPIDTIFDFRLNNVMYPATSGVLVASRTPVASGIVAQGLKMLGYSMSTGGFINGGIAGWNSNYGEKQTSDGQVRPGLTYALIDAAAPTVTSISSGDITHDSATITRNASEPATLKIEYGPAAGVYTNAVNDTVLNASKSVSLTGLNPDTTYYWRATSYDGMANGTASAEASFSTTPVGDPSYRPDIVPLKDPHSYWNSYADFLAGELSVDLQIANLGLFGAYDVSITGATNSNGVTLSSSLPVHFGNINGGTTAMMTLKYHIPAGAGSMVTRLEGTASNSMGVTYYYP
ncbi:MAG: fibronectin type III domain-containing protein [Thermoleophilia bacterium]|nr:fibronectin type III domain-containing protein [Thermoleophilia bacterium]